MSYKRLLQAVAILGRKLISLAPEGGTIGVMLPTSNGGVITTFAVMSAGRVPATINFTAGAANILAACRAAAVDTIFDVTNLHRKGKLEKLIAQLETSIRILYLEDIRTPIGPSDKLRGQRCTGRSRWLRASPTTGR